MSTRRVTPHHAGILLATACLLFASVAEAQEPGPATQAPTYEGAAAGHRLGFALKAALFLPTARTGASSLTPIGAAADRALSGAGALDLIYSPPFLGNALQARLGVGYSPLAGSGEASFPADPDFGTFSYSYFQSIVPLTLGVHYVLPLSRLVEGPLGKLRASGGLGAAAVFVTSTATYEKDGGSVEDASQSGTAGGYYLGLEVAWPLGPGELLGEYRFVSARTDLGLNEVYGTHVNDEPGEVQGSFVYLGYRMLFSF